VLTARPQWLLLLGWVACARPTVTELPSAELRAFCELSITTRDRPEARIVPGKAWSGGRRRGAAEGNPLGIGCFSDGEDYSLWLEASETWDAAKAPLGVGEYPVVALTAAAEPLTFNGELSYSDFQGWVFTSGSLTFEELDQQHVRGRFVVHGVSRDGHRTPVTVTGSFDLPRP
jgi:hypothetical protein